MLKNISSLEGTQALSKSEQKLIMGGFNPIKHEGGLYSEYTELFPAGCSSGALVGCMDNKDTCVNGVCTPE